MKIILPKNLIKLDGKQLIKALIKIIKIESRTTTVLLNGKIIKIPYVLKPDKKYTGTIKKNTLEINEVSKKNIKLFEKIKVNDSDKFNNLLEKLFSLKNSKENDFGSIKDFLFNLFYSKIRINGEYFKKERRKSYCFRSKEGNDYYFFFNLLYFKKPARIFLKIDKNKNVFLNIFADDIHSFDNDFFTSTLKNSIKERINSILVDFSDNKEDFCKKINSRMNFENVDIKI